MTQEEIKKACNAMFTGGTFETTSSLGYFIKVCNNRIFVDNVSVARVNGNRLYVSVVNSRNQTTRDLLNALPNCHIVRDNGVYKLNGTAWDGGWFRVVDDLYKHEDDL